jgi:hypothetical protein
MIDSTDIVFSSSGLAANALRAQFRQALERGLTAREQVELLALTFSLKCLLDDLDADDDPLE